MIEISLHKTLNNSGTPFEMDFKIELEEGIIHVVTGKSGAGKTSFLRLIAGLLHADHGELKVKGDVWYHSDKKINVKPQQRSIGMLFQDYALFPHLTVMENLKMGLSKSESKEISKELLQLFEIDQLLDRAPETLSGGQQQRVALARALVGKPSILLLDEPLNAIDFKLRFKLQEILKRIQREYQFTIIMVSHDQAEMIKVADQIVEIEDGKIKRKGSVSDLYSIDQWNNQFSFIGEVISIQKQGISFLINILIGNNAVKVIGSPEIVKTLKAGDQVRVASKGFNPVIQKVENQSN